jgi:rhodanese-related sulfurtransferase
MRRSLLVYIIAIVVVALMVFLTIKLLPAETKPAQISSTVSVTQAADLFAAGAFLLDVREPSEWEAGHVDGAVLIPLGQLAARASEVPTDKIVLVICRSGNRSADGRDILKDAGLTQVTSVSGGMNAWIQAGLPVVTGP